MSNGRTSNRQAEKPKEEKSGPVWSKRAWTGSGSVECAIFAKTVEGDNGPYEVHNTVLKRSFKTDEGYDSSNSFRVEDLLIGALFLQEAALFILNEQSRK